MKDDTKEIVSYVFVGGMTTLVNYVVYFILLKIHSHWLIANSISWIFAVLFAYYTNKRYVFKSTNNIKKEFKYNKIFNEYFINAFKIVGVEPVGIIVEMNGSINEYEHVDEIKPNLEFIIKNPKYFKPQIKVNTSLVSLKEFEKLNYQMSEIFDDIEYYDEMYVSAPDNKCAIQDGVFKYTHKTVPVIRFDYEFSSSSEEEDLERFYDKIEDVRYECKLSVINNKKQNTKANITKCDCIVDFITDEFLALKDKTDVDKEKFEKELSKKIEKRCGKIPDFMKN